MQGAAVTMRNSLFSVARAIYRRLIWDERVRLRITSVLFRNFGRLLGPPDRRLKGFQPESPHPARQRLSDIASYLGAPADDLPVNTDSPVTRFMFHIWRSRPDLTRAFDLYNPASRREFCKWFVGNASMDYGLTAEAYPQELLKALSRQGDGNVAQKAADLLQKKKEMHAIQHASATELLPEGANLIGYARGEFGMGEHVRMTARSFSTVAQPFAVVNIAEMGGHGAADSSIEHWIGGAQNHAVNIFHVNADVFPQLYYRFGEAFFDQHYNIGYWAWELPHCPPEFDLALNMVDEVWTLSQFVCDALKERSPVPVINMSMAVTVPELQRSYSKLDFGVPEDCFVFLSIFDAASYLDRKNPIAAVRAFKAAFPLGNEKVRLLLKTMNVPEADPLWQDLLAEVETDARISVISRRMVRDEVVGLNSVCNTLVSLHRSEGFGLCIAESMLLGKPVIATNYSGSREFAREGTACVVDYKLIPVPKDSYLLADGQVWADPDIEHAAYLMRKLTEDENFRSHIAQAGQRYVKDNFNVDVIGRRYAARLGELKPLGFKRGGTMDEDAAADRICGAIDLPATITDEQQIPSGAIQVAGWVVSKTGITRVEVYCDGKWIGEAHYGVLRPDLLESYADFRDAGRGGYFWLMDTSRMAHGRHELGVRAYSRSGIAAEMNKTIYVGDADAVYQRWLAAHEPTAEQRQILRAEIAAQGNQTLSVVALADEGCTSGMLNQTLQGLQQQLHQNWQLLICADSAVAPALQEWLVAAGEVRATLIAAPAWREILAACGGDHIGVIELGDVLDHRALWAVIKNIMATPDAGLLYADEDRLHSGNRTAPCFKPAWSPIYLEHYNYIGRPWFASASVLKEVIKDGELCDTMSEHGLLQRLGKAANKIVHIPMVLCSRHAASAEEDQVPALSQRSGNSPKVSVVIPTCLRHLNIIEKCFSSLLLRTDYPNLEVIIVKNNVSNEEDGQQFLARWPFKVITWEGSFSWSGINNFGARHASGELLLFFNDDVEALNRDWLSNMVEIAMRDSVGAAGAMLMYPNRTIQHGGTFFIGYGGGARHLFRFCNGTESHIAHMVNHSRESSAVTGACLLVRREVFDAVQGFDENLPLVNNDTDFCLRLEQQKLASIVVADAKLIHHEGVSRIGMSETADNKRFWAQWGARLEACDPYSNPNLNDRRDDWWLNPEAQPIWQGRVSDGCRG